MVFLGLGILVVSLSFLVYKNRPLSFPKLDTLWRRREGIEDRKRGEEKAEEGSSRTESVREKGLPDPLFGFKDDGFREESDNEHASPQTTPKAIPTTTTDSAPIPTFTLSDGDSPAITTGFTVSSSTTLNPPSKGPSTPSSLNQPQHRSQPTSMPPPSRPTTTSKRKPQTPTPAPMPPPPLPTAKPTPTHLRPIPTTTSTLRPPPSPASTLRAPPRSTLSPSTSTRPSKKVLLAPAHSPLDWAHLITHPPSPTFFRGAALPPHLIRVPPSLLRLHNGRKGRDAWATWQGRVYNLTPYMGFHPGGHEELMRGVGREGVAERLFAEVHPWVSWEGLLGECLVGVCVGEAEAEAEAEAGLEEVD